MNLPPKSWIHALHGDSTHDALIFLLEREIIRANSGNIEYTFLDKAWFKDKYISASIPDIYFWKREVNTTSRGKNRYPEQKYVIEVESHATAGSIAKKREHFLESTNNHELLIINLGDYPVPEDLAALARIQLWCRGWVP
jgi:hypothetical protein